jgi:hypothetical protein
MQWLYNTLIIHEDIEPEPMDIIKVNQHGDMQDEEGKTV